MAAEAPAVRSAAADAGAHQGWAAAPAPLPSPPATNAAGLAPRTNLDSFLLSTTPALGAGHTHAHAPLCAGLHCRQCSSRSKERGREKEKEKEKEIEGERDKEGGKEHDVDRDGKAPACPCGSQRACFLLEDVWESYREWSLFGSGVPLWDRTAPPPPGPGRGQARSPGQGQGEGAGGAASRASGPGSHVGPTGRGAADPSAARAGYSASTAVQYYIPYLSALQLYSAPCKAPLQPGQNAVPQRASPAQQAQRQGNGADGNEEKPSGKGNGVDDAADRASGNAMGAAQGEEALHVANASANGPIAGGSASAGAAAESATEPGSGANHRKETQGDALERANDSSKLLEAAGKESTNNSHSGAHLAGDAAAAEHRAQAGASHRSSDAESNAAAGPDDKAGTPGKDIGDAQTAALRSAAVAARASGEEERVPGSSTACPKGQSASPCCCCCSGRTKELLFEFLERAPPHSRPPLLEKITELKTTFPDIMELCSSQLHPDSWFSVAWYPLYRIPAGPPLQDSSASFLTFHGLSSVACCHGRAGAGGPAGPSKASTKHDCRCFKGLGPPRVPPLEPFALSHYKTKGGMRAPGPLDISSSTEGEKALSTKQAAAVAWVTHVDVHHPDHEFFMAHSSR